MLRHTMALAPSLVSVDQCLLVDVGGKSFNLLSCSVCTWIVGAEVQMRECVNAGEECMFKIQLNAKYEVA